MYNKAFLIGRLTKDPEKRYTPLGVPVTRFTLAVNRRRVRENEPEADFIQVVAWRKLAEICAEFLKKGRLVAVEGALRINDFVGRDGIRRSFPEIIAEDMRMLEKKPDSFISEASSNNENEEFPQALDFNPEAFEA